MCPYKENAEFGLDPNARVALISFKDPAVGDADQVLQQFTSDKTALQSAINALSAGGGGDIPEGDNSGLLLALDGSAGSWDLASGVTRKIILYTDAPVKDTDLEAQVDQYAHDLNTVITKKTVGASPSGQSDTFTLAAPAGAAAMAPAVVEIDTIQVGNDATATASIQKIATDNGGIYLDAPTPDELTKAIVKDITNPVTTTTGSFTIADQTTGKTTTMTGQAYTGPVTGLTSQLIFPTTD